MRIGHADPFDLQPLEPRLILDMSLIQTYYGYDILNYSVTGATSYLLYRGGTQIADLGSASSGSYADHTNPSGAGGNYAILDADTGNVLETMITPFARVSGDSVTLQWQPNGPYSDLWIPYIVQTPDGSGVADVYADYGDAITLANLGFETPFQFRVFDVAADTASATVSGTTAPAPLASFTADFAYYDAAELTLDTGGSTGSPYFNVYRGDTPDFPTDAAHRVAQGVGGSGVSTILDLTPFAAGTNYYFKATRANPWTGAESVPLSVSARSPYVSPTVTYVAAISAAAMVPFHGTLATFAPSGAQTQPGDYSASIDWGDQTAPSTATILSNADGSFSVQGRHTYALSAEGAGTVSVSVTHYGSGLSSSGQSTTLVASPNPLSVSAQPIHATAHIPFTDPLATFLPCAADTQPSDYAATIDWGDASAPTVGTIAANADGSFSVSGLHTYAPNASPAPASVSVVDAAALSYGSANAAVSLTTPITLQPVNARTLHPGDLLSLPVGFTDADPTQTHTASIAWGDGTTSAAQVLEHAGSGSVFSSHLYPTAGAYQATLTVLNTQDDAAQETASITIQNAAPSLAALVNRSAVEGIPLHPLHRCRPPRQAHRDRQLGRRNHRPRHRRRIRRRRRRLRVAHLCPWRRLQRNARHPGCLRRDRFHNRGGHRPKRRSLARRRPRDPASRHGRCRAPLRPRL